MFRIKSFELQDIPAVRKFTDRWIGSNYFTDESLEEILEISTQKGKCSSLIALEEERLVGVRITYAPGRWIYQQRGLSIKDWPITPDKVGYFKSLFVADDFQNRGVGRSLSLASLEILKEIGAGAVICHSWLESPGNGSSNYLEKLGFQPVKRHEKFWLEVDYQCVKCAPERCICTALEMIKIL